MHLFTKKKLITLAASSFVLFIFSVVLALVILPAIIDSQIDKNVQLVRGTDQWHRFKEVPFNASLNVTFFEVTNVDEVIHNKSKPNLREKGPYVFDEVMKKVNIIYNENNDTISYEHNSQFYFNQSRSGPNVSIDDKVNLVNPPYVVLLQMVRDILNELTPFATGFVLKCMKAAFPDDLIMKDFPVRKLMFDGVELCNFKNPDCKVDIPFVLHIDICQMFLNKTRLIEEVNEGDQHYVKFSFLNYRRSGPDGVYQVKTGISDINDVAKIVQWNYSNFSKIWVQDRQNNSCDLVKGTDGTVLPPHLTESTVISTYSTDICSSVDVYYNGTDTYKGIEGYLYRPKDSLFSSTLSNPLDNCFCSQKTLDINGEKSCFLDGVIDLYPCLGTAVLLSFPHFLNANKSYLEGLTGDILPDSEKHGIYMLVDKYSGIPLRAHKRIQMSIILRPLNDFPQLTSNLPKTILPIAWVDEGVDLPDSGLDILNSLLYNTLKLVDIAKWVFMGITLTLTIMSCILLCKHLYSS